jgi:hypothetical protein
MTPRLFTGTAEERAMIVDAIRSRASLYRQAAKTVGHELLVEAERLDDLADRIEREGKS